MADPTDSVVQHLGRRESLVTTFVGQDPDTSTDHTLDDGVQSPEGNTSRHEGDILRGGIVVEEVEDGSEDGNVTENIVQAGDG